MKVYDKVKDLLIKYPELRNSDKKLLWAIWTVSGLTENGVISKEKFYDASASESITRARRMVQVDFPLLQATKEIQEKRQEKQKEKGTHVYRTTLPFKSHKRFDEDGIVRDCECQIGKDH